jgi:hypothetical protein
MDTTTIKNLSDIDLYLRENLDTDFDFLYDLVSLYRARHDDTAETPKYIEDRGILKRYDNGHDILSQEWLEVPSKMLVMYEKVMKALYSLPILQTDKFDVIRHAYKFACQ